MKVWELMAHLSKCPAGADVTVGISATMDACATHFGFEEGEVYIRSLHDVMCIRDDGETELLSSLIAVDDEE